MKGVVSFTLTGDVAADAAGARRQAALFNEYSRVGAVRWRLRFLVGKSVPGDTLDALEELGARVIPLTTRPEDRTSSFWRFHALPSDSDFYLFRDVNGRLCARERAAIDVFVRSGSSFHVMRDHPYHFGPILPGLWGFSGRGKQIVSDVLPTTPSPRFFERFNRRFGARLTSNDFEGVDLLWLWTYVWPRIKKEALIHAELAPARFERPERRLPFPTPRQRGEFVGKTWTEDDAESRLTWSDPLERYDWFVHRQAASDVAPVDADVVGPTRVVSPDRVVVKLLAGLGNNVFQILAGHALARRLSATGGGPVTCEVVVPDAMDPSRTYSVYEPVGGHLRADNHFSRRHRDFGLPAPADLPAVFPGMTWRQIGIKRPLRADQLADRLVDHHLASERFSEVLDDAEHVVDPAQPDVGKVLNAWFFRSFYPFPMRHWYPEVKELAALFEPGEAVARYLRVTYGDDPLIGIHVRNDQRVADIHRSDAVPVEWYVDCVVDVLKTGQRGRILLVSNQVKNNEASQSTSAELKAALARLAPGVEIVESTREPYYVDFFLLRSCKYLVVSSSTFGFAAGLVSPRLERMYVPDSYSERHFMDGKFPESCAFLRDRGLSSPT